MWKMVYKHFSELSKLYLKKMRNQDKFSAQGISSLTSIVITSLGPTPKHGHGRNNVHIAIYSDKKRTIGTLN